MEKIDLFIGVCVTYDDYLSYKDQLESSLSNLSELFIGDVYIYMIIQSRELNVEVIETLLPNCVEYDSVFGISRARNKCIEKSVSMQCDYILFHDASIYWTPASVRFISEFRDSSPLIDVDMSDDIDFTESRMGFDLKIINPVYFTHVGSYLLKVSDIKNVRFNEEFGPGDLSNFNCGEDTLFLFDLFSKRQSYRACKSSFLSLYHPPRDSDFSKHLYYAKGQGAMFGVLVNKHRSFSTLLDCCLFFGNAIWRLFLMRRNSLQILKFRVFGFLYGYRL
ncbi:hypothetical protein AB4347_16990 [Vibrio breoganii]